MTKLVLTRGNVASGKSTFAREWVSEDPEWRAEVNRDDLRFSLFGKYVLDRHGEETVTSVQQAMVKTLLGLKRSVIISDTNLTARFVKEWLKIARDLGVETEFVDFNTPLEECLRRNKARGDAGGRFVPEDVIRSFDARFFRKGKLSAPPTLDEPLEVRRKYTPGTSLPKAYLFDIDGTLAEMSDRGPFDWHRVGEDTPIANVVELLRRLQQSGAQIVFMSGRDRVCYNVTAAWLYKAIYRVETPVTQLAQADFTNIFELYMRPENDMRKDSVVKHELFYQHVADKYNVIGVVDDRQQVVDMWREIGLTVFQCAPGNF